MATTKASNNSEANGIVGIHRLVRYGLFAVIVTSIVNVLVLAIGLATFEFPSEFVGGQFGPLALGPVVVNSAVAAIGATLVYGVISRYAAKPNRTFVIIAGVILVLSFGMFLAPDISDAPPRVFVLLAVMHVTAAAAIVSVLTRTTSSEAELQ